MNVIGIDPSLNGTGLCYSGGDAQSLIFRNRKDDPKNDYRLAIIRQTIEGIITNGDLDIQIAVIEVVPPYGKGSASLGLVQGVVREVLAANGVPVLGVSPSPLKKFATGNGRADKRDMLAHLPYGLGEGWDDNAVDAWWLRQAGLAYGGQPHHGMSRNAYDVTTMMKEKF